MLLWAAVLNGLAAAVGFLVIIVAIVISMFRGWERSCLMIAR